MQKVLKVSLVLVVVMALGVYALNSVVNGADDLIPAERMKRYQKLWDEAYLEGNLDALDDEYGPHTVKHRPNVPDVIGLDGIKGEIKTNRLIFSKCRVIFDELLVSGDRLISQWTFQGTYAGKRSLKWIFQSKGTGESKSINTSTSPGAKFTMKGCTISRSVNGKIVEEWTYWDSTVPALAAAGIELKMEPVEE